MSDDMHRLQRPRPGGSSQSRGDEQHERLLAILSELDKQQREEGYHTEPANRPRKPRWRIYLFLAVLAGMALYLLVSQRNDATKSGGMGSGCCQHGREFAGAKVL